MDEKTDPITKGSEEMQSFYKVRLSQTAARLVSNNKNFRKILFVAMSQVICAAMK